MTQNFEQTAPQSLLQKSSLGKSALVERNQQKFQQNMDRALMPPLRRGTCQVALETQMGENTAP